MDCWASNFFNVFNPILRLFFTVCSLSDRVWAMSRTARLSKRESSITRLCVCGYLSSCWRTTRRNSA